MASDKHKIREKLSTRLSGDLLYLIRFILSEISRNSGTPMIPMELPVRSLGIYSCSLKVVAVVVFQGLGAINYVSLENGERYLLSFLLNPSPYFALLLFAEGKQSLLDAVLQY